MLSINTGAVCLTGFQHKPRGSMLAGSTHMGSNKKAAKTGVEAAVILRGCIVSGRPELKL